MRRRGQRKRSDGRRRGDEHRPYWKEYEGTQLQQTTSRMEKQRGKRSDRNRQRDEEEEGEGEGQKRVEEEE